MRVRVAVPPIGFGERLNRMHAWLDNTRGADGWEITPAGRSVVNDAIAIYFREPAFATAFAARWCAPVSSGITEGVLQIRGDEPVVDGNYPGGTNDDIVGLAATVTGTSVPVPEPSSLALLTSGLMFIAGKRPRRGAVLG